DTRPRTSLPPPEPAEPDTTPTGHPLAPDEPSVTAADALPHRRGVPVLAVGMAIALLCGGAIVLVLRGVGVLRPVEDVAEPAPIQAPAPAAEAVKATDDDGAQEPHARPPVRSGRATLVLTSDRPALARTGGRELGMTPITVTLTSGRHRLVLQTLDGQTTRTVEIDMPRGGTVKHHVAMTP
ncbi:MAG: hypothetical protein IRZ16_18180, partial [Myxococcaceae bacterium]|nr:hypothetical protein [Myxococcaceae bacterium]